MSEYTLGLVVGTVATFWQFTWSSVSELTDKEEIHLGSGRHTITFDLFLPTHVAGLDSVSDL